jgi:DNA polymerase-3 subunit epsilon
VSWFGWLRAAKPRLDATQQQRLAQLRKPTALGGGLLRSQRWVVVDLETTGLNLNRDQVLSIGAVVIEDGAVDFSQLFERTLHRAETKLSPSVLIHGLGPSAIAAGSDPVDALLEFMEFVVYFSLLPFHPRSTQYFLRLAFKESLRYRLAHPFLDVAEIAPMLCPQAPIREAGLDDWIEYFNLQVGERHHASADALATAELMLILLSRARQQHIDTPQSLQERLSQWKRRKQAPSF